MINARRSQLSYKDAGVDIEAGNALVENIKDAVKQTKRPEVQSSLGGFGALCSIPAKYNKPILVSATDGVGTKLRLAVDCNKHETIGQDLVAMCVNDLIVQGAEPLFFLDYYATSKLDINVATTVIKSIANACIEAGCALIGGETAEMPNMYKNGDYDLAGFCVGVVEEDEIIHASKVRAGNVLIGLASSGPHSNGYSLIRKILEINDIDLTKEKLNDTLLQDYLLAPTKIYVKSILQLIKQVNVTAVAHITGGGFWENIPRVLPDHVGVVIDESSWEWPSIFKWIQKTGNISTHEMYKTFNCGVGMVIAVDEEHVETAMLMLQNKNEQAWIIGEIVHYNSEESKRVVIK